MESPKLSEARDAQPVRLSPEQKRDLAGQALAAVLTTAMMTASFGLLTRGVPPPTIAAADGLPAAVAMGSPVTIPTLPSAPRQAARKSIRPENVDAQAKVTEVVPIVSTAAAESGKRGRDRNRFARRLAGLLTGDGSYAIHPFPTVPTER